MKYAVQGLLTFNVMAQRNLLRDELINQIANKTVWGEIDLRSGEKEDNPNQSLQIRFNTETNMNEMFDWIKDQMVRIPVLKGVVSKHKCSHDENNDPCVILEKFEV